MSPATTARLYARALGELGPHSGEMADNESRHSASGQPLQVPLRIVLSHDERRELLRGLTMEGVSVARLAELLGLPAATIYRDLGPKPRPPRHGKGSMLEAGLVWHARYGWLPTSADWNGALARGTSGTLARRRPGAFERWAAGYHPIADPTAWMPWPYHRQITRVWRTFPAYKAGLDDEINRRVESNDPYEPIPWNPVHAWATWLPREMRANTDSMTYRFSDLYLLLSLAGLRALGERLREQTVRAS